MTLHLIGIGLNDGKDITVRGLETLSKCKKTYLETYTSLLQCTVQELEKQLKTKITLADRNDIEQAGDKIIQEAKTQDIALLVVGDVFGATTHLDIYLRAKQKQIPVTVTFNASIINAIGITGLELYRFGQTTSIPYFMDSYKPTTPLNVICQNLKLGLHTLCLLDIKPPKFMTVNEAVNELMEMQKITGKKVLTPNTPALGCARIGSQDFKIAYATLSKLKTIDFGKPLHSLVIPGKLHFMEEEALKQWEQ